MNAAHSLAVGCIDLNLPVALGLCSVGIDLRLTLIGAREGFAREFCFVAIGPVALAVERFRLQRIRLRPLIGKLRSDFLQFAESFIALMQCVVALAEQFLNSASCFA
jgi:hypothetical protein